MPPKKKQKGPTFKGQLTLDACAMKSQTIENDPNVIKYQIEKEVEKLIRIRRQIEQKRREEERVVNKLMKLQIGTDNTRAACLGEMAAEEDEEYWIMTTDESLNQNTNSLLKLILEDYGSVVISKKAQQLKGSPQIQEETINEEASQWREKGILNSQYLSDYTQSFIHSLKEYQYVANDLQASSN